ncbi:MAG: tyrosine--tRNA ligase [Candidatus Saccharibacteria bacterium]|nr:tyrosine--tRNA ligase [Candidatus Saccharibacteria bacterium]
MVQESLTQELIRRGFVNQTTFKSMKDLDSTKRTFYLGVDPSAASMTIGNLASIMMVRTFIRHGHKAILLIGGATGMIGDPDGKNEERELKPLEEIEQNKKQIVEQYRTILDGLDFEVVDNYSWFKDMNYLDFLRDIGKKVPMRQMLGRDFVNKRLSADGMGISYAEFSYVLVQAYDFLHLHKEKDATLQICGSDQWGNAIAGVDLIRRVTGNETHVWSTPLVVNKSTGVKFGKSEAGAVWLNPDMTTPYQFYQFWLNLDDAGVDDYLRIYTEISEEDISATMSDFEKNKSQRAAQKKLAYEATKFIHGLDTANSVRKISEALFGNTSFNSLATQDFVQLSKELGSTKVSKDDSLIDILVASHLASSKGDARRFIEAKAVYINGTQIGPENATLDPDTFIEGYMLLRRGKNNQTVICLQ